MLSNLPSAVIFYCTPIILTMNTTRTQLRRTSLLAALSLALASSLPAQHEIGFVEKFALAPDRAVVLKELIPGTEDYYFYHALHFQNTRKQKELTDIIGQWAKRNPDSSLLREIRHRQSLLDYDTNPKATLDYLKNILGVQFNHQQETLNPKPNLPTQLDQQLISMAQFVSHALANQHNLDASKVTDLGLEYLLVNKSNLTVEQRRVLLSRIRRPDVPNLLDVILADFGTQESRGFGEFPIHSQLLLEQLQQLRKVKPELAQNPQFVNAWLTRLRPNADTDISRNVMAREVWLEAAWTFVKDLEPTFNSLKAHILYQRLVHDQKLGKYSLERFMEYLKLPRPVYYISPLYREKNEALFQFPVDMNANFTQVTSLPVIGNDEPLVRSYLLHFLADAPDYKAFAPYVSQEYLKPLLAEAKLTNGIGNAEQWFSMLSPSVVQALRERVDIDFDPTNPEVIAPDAVVGLDAFVKNVSKLTINVYEINTENYYRAHNAQIGTDLNLDGLIANKQQAFDYSDAPVLRMKRNFKLDSIPARRGVWVVDFIGNGKSSRALIRKGQLNFVTRASSAGTALAVLDEKRQPVVKAYALLGGQRYVADEHGEIVIPFSNKPGRQAVTIGDGNGFARLENIDLQGEVYALHAGFHAARESLIAGKKANIAIRPTLTVNGAPVDVNLLEEVKLTIVSKNHDGVASSIVKPDFKLRGDQESTVEITVPERLASLSLTLEAKVKSLITGAKVPLAASFSLALNQKDTSEQTSDLFLSRIGSTYSLQELGRTGEPRSERALVVRAWRAEFSEPRTINLKTDPGGTVQLGELDGIARIEVRNPNGVTRMWNLPVDRADAPANVHIAAGKDVAVPWMEGDVKPVQPLVSLLEVRHGLFVRDVLSDKTVSVKSGYLIISNLDPGDYNLRYGQDRRVVNIRVTQGAPASGWLLGEARLLQSRPSVPLQIIDVAQQKENISISIGNATKDTRVHVLASRFLPGIDAFTALGDAPGLEPLIGQPSRLRSLYVSGRTLGEEYRYVLERRMAKKFPGSMLPRPGLLLNPWALRTTETSIADAMAGEAYRRADDGRAAGMDGANKKRMASPPGGLAGMEITNVDFLAEPGSTAFNLTPDKDGRVTLKMSDLGDRQFVRILAVNGNSSVVRDLSLADAKTKLRDLTLRNGLDPQGHFTRQNQVSILEKGAPFTMKDAATAKFETSESLGGIFTLFRTLSNNLTLAEFSFVLDWPTLDAAKKRELYSKYACHELSFFLQRKDPAFFKSVILPYLANKKDKTFMDHYLLGDDLRSYLRPWDYQRLNMVERILLAQRHKEESAATGRELSDRKAMQPPNVDEMLLLFDTALQGGDLAGGAADKLGVAGELRDNLIRREISVAPGDANKPVSETSAMLAAPAAPMAAMDGAGGARFAAPALKSKNGRALKMEQDAKAPEEKDMAADEAKPMDKRLEELGEDAGKFKEGLDHDINQDREARRGRQQQLYRKLESTQEWAENNYYHLPIEQQLADLVGVNGFWKDYALWDGKGGFLSKNVGEAAHSFTEMMLALAVLDLPFPSQSKVPKAEVKDLSLTLTPVERMILFHREIKPAEIDKEAPRLLVSQNFYRQGDRYIEKDGEKLDKFVTDEFLTGIVYGCQIVVTNPTSSTQKLDLLLQIPQGAIPVLGSKATDSRPLRLESYRTHTADYYFYFPKAGKYAHHPVHVSKTEKVVAFAPPFTFNVVNELTKLDTGSWDYISQFGKPEDVLAFLDQHNVHQLNLDRMAWRLKDADFFKKALELLAKRHVYHSTTWSYALMHNSSDALRDYLLHADGFIAECGPWLTSKLLTIDPVARYRHQHLEYSPLVNARAHQLGAGRSILNDRFSSQYQSLLGVLAHRAVLDHEDMLTTCYYIFLQDRVEEALAMFDKVDAAKVAEHLQYDYMKAVAAMYREDTATARQIAQTHVKHDVDRWKDKFVQVLAQIDEMQGKKSADVKEDDREQKQNDLATTEPTLDFTVENKEVKLAYHNLKEVTVNYYPMDLEFLFSTAPFVGQDTSRFGMIQPNRSEHMVLPADRETHSFALPREYHSSNVLVEITSAGKTVARAYYANELNIQVSENYGRIQVLHAKDSRPLSKVYVKVFTEINGQAKFYKDGYTDLRGKFDYLSLSTGEIDQATRFSVLVLSEEFGAAVRELKPPRQ